MTNTRGPLNSRGHEFCTHPPLVNQSLKSPAKVGKNILQCNNVQGLEQGLYIISQPLLINPTNTPEARHHIFLQVYQDSDAETKIAQAQALVDQLQSTLDKSDFGSYLDRQKFRAKLNRAEMVLKETKQASNRAQMIQVFGPTVTLCGSIVTVASVDDGQTIDPDMNDPHTVVSPILTISDVERVEGNRWVDPDLNAQNESIEKIRRTAYNLLKDNCKTAAITWIHAALDAMPGLTPELMEIAKINLAKPINANTPFTQILKNSVGRGTANAAWVFNTIAAPDEKIPESPPVYGGELCNTEYMYQLLI